MFDVTSETLRQWESLHSEEASSNELGTIRLIHTACKAVQKQCSEQAGFHVMFRAYFHTQGVSSFPIAKFKGNRFNIVFYNAGGVYFLRHHLLNYLENVCHTRNKLLQAILKDLKHPLYLTVLHDDIVKINVQRGLQIHFMCTLCTSLSLSFSPSLLLPLSQLLVKHVTLLLLT